MLALSSKMLNFLPQIVFLVVLGIIIFLISRKIPEASSQLEKEEENLLPRKSFLEKLPLEKIDQHLNVILEKFLRRLRIYLMKFDAYCQKRLEVLKSQEKEKEKILFENQEQEEISKEDESEELKEEREKEELEK